jgi:hypothetical protein
MPADSFELLAVSADYRCDAPAARPIVSVGSTYIGLPISCPFEGIPRTSSYGGVDYGFDEVRRLFEQWGIVLREISKVLMYLLTFGVPSSLPE